MPQKGLPKTNNEKAKINQALENLKRGAANINI
jgi:hypothetical protein